MAAEHGPPRLARALLWLPARQRSQPARAPRPPPRQRSDAPHAAAGQHRHARRWRAPPLPQEAPEKLHLVVLLPRKKVQHMDLRSPRRRR